MKKIFSEILSLNDAFKVFLDYLDKKGSGRLPSEIISTRESLGRITAKPVFARYSSPSYHSAAMDGYAVRFEDTLTASEAYPCLLKIGQQAVYVDTGDPMPSGFNAVIMVEDVNIIKEAGVDKLGDSATEGYIEIYQPVTPYQHVRSVGEDIVATELIIPENHKIRAVDIGAMIASGNEKIYVRRKPVVSIIPTGSELVRIEDLTEDLPKPPQIIEYNSSMLSCLAIESGASPVVYNIVKDDLDEIKKSIKQAVKGSDIVLLNAGSGRGSEDFTLQALQELGEVIINGVAIKPGKPFIASFVDNKPVFGIPGYPVSAYMTFRLFVLPLIERMLGCKMKERETIAAISSRQISSSLGSEEFIRVKIGMVGDKTIATPVGRGAGLLMSLVRADGIIRIPSGVEALSSGSEVEVELIRDKGDIRNTIVCIGSHDNTLDILANLIKKYYPRFSLSSAHVGSMAGLAALKRKEAHIAGTHLLDEQSGEYNIPFIKRLFREGEVVLVNLVYREQGLVVKKGNPKKISGFEDLLRDDVIFINRQAGSGTRLLLDKHIRELGINPMMIKGYEREEYTHMSVASAVLTGLADTGLAIYSSAKALGLDFIPVARERYDLAIPAEYMDTEKIDIILKILRESEEFKEMVKILGGYDTSEMGKIISN